MATKVHSKSLDIDTAAVSATTRESGIYRVNLPQDTEPGIVILAFEPARKSELSANVEVHFTTAHRPDIAGEDLMDRSIGLDELVTWGRSMEGGSTSHMLDI